jgi:RsiW-degrading membrane proteinase PrsW (M82 family)
MNGLFLSAAAGALPMALYASFLYYLDRYEKEPLKLLVGMFLWGAIIAAGLSFLVNSISSLGFYIITQSDFATQIATSTLIAPLAEETLKGAAILIVFLVYRPEFDSPLDGIVYGGIAALGFAATENIWYIHQFGYLQGGYQGLLEIALIRVILVGWQHPFYTAFTGLGFALSRQAKDKFWQWLFPITGWAFAVAFHLLHNLFSVLAANSEIGISLNLIWDWSGYIGLFALILLFIKREQKWMKTFLAQEMENGLISPHQYQIACSAWRQSLAYLREVPTGKLLQLRTFYQTCGNLMHKIRQAQHSGGVSKKDPEIENLRARLVSLGQEI